MILHVASGPAIYNFLKIILKAKKERQFEYNISKKKRQKFRTKELELPTKDLKYLMIIMIKALESHKCKEVNFLKCLLLLIDSVHDILIKILVRSY